ncbi:MAG: DHA2 family efflux MFS transporter permease subunit [Rickettsiales bacterium]
MSGSAEHGVANRGLITASAILASMIYALDWTIASVALPHMQGTFSATQDQISWVLTSYIVTSAIIMPSTGWLSDRFGRRRLFLVSIVGFTVMSFFCGAVDSLEAEILMRILQGAFGAALIPVSQAIMLDIYPPEEHAKATALWGMGVVLGPVIGPTVGGWLTEHYTWRWVFYINIPVGLLAFLGCFLFLPDTERKPGRRFDWFGFLALAAAIGALQTMLDRGERLDWFNSVEIIVEAAIVGVGFYLFVIHALTVRQPMVDLRLMRDRNYALGLIIAFLYGVLTLAPLVLMPPLLKELKDYPVIDIGLLLSPRGAGLMIAMTVLGRTAQHFDPRVLIGGGFVLLAVSSWAMAGWNLDIGHWEVLWTGCVQGVGAGMIVVPLGAVTFATLDPSHRTEAASMWNLIRSAGSSIGISVGIFFLTRMGATSRAELTEHVNPFNLMFELPQVAGRWSTETLSDLARLDLEITRQAMMVGYIDVFYMFAFAAAIALPAVFLLAKPAPRG